MLHDHKFNNKYLHTIFIKDTIKYLGMYLEKELMERNNI